MRYSDQAKAIAFLILTLCFLAALVLFIWLVCEGRSWRITCLAIALLLENLALLVALTIRILNDLAASRRDYWTKVREILDDSLQKRG